MPNADEQERREDLASTSESLKDDARRVTAIEEEKGQLDAGDPRVKTLSREAERVAGEVARKSQVERDLSERGPGGRDDSSRNN